MELPAQLYEKIESLSDEGGSHFDDGDYEAAVEKWMRALECVPAPKDDWEATHWLCASIGDAYYQQSRFDRAREFLLDALNAPGGLSSPFVFYRLGQSEARLGNSGAATDYLLRAYMLDGTDIFEADPEGSAYLKMLDEQGLLPKAG
jgi:tetratricopeptide (TPR) repeat protein